MDSEPLGDVGGDLREKHKWAEGSIVYKRKNHKKGLKINNNQSSIVSNNNNNLAQPSSQALETTTKDANSLQPQTLSRLDAPSADSSSHTPHAENGRENMNMSANGVKPGGPNVEKVRFCSVSMRSKVEKRDLRRKLLGELDQVRGLVKKLEGSDRQLSGYAQSQVSGDDGIDRGGSALRVNSEVGSVGAQDSRPFRGLSVSVMENSHGVAELMEKEKRTPKVNKYYQNPDFVLGKDKFPPPESNKKSKSNGMVMAKYLVQVFKNCSNLLAKLMKHKHGWVFNSPVDVKGLGLHDYYSIIKHPMDFGTIKSRLSKNLYKSPREFAEDVRLTLHNAMTYNPKGQDVHIMAEELLKIFEEKWAAIEADLYWRFGMGHDAGTPTPTSRKAPYHHHPEMRNVDRSDSIAMPADSNLKPGNSAHMRMQVPKKPKAKDPHKRDMTYEEKQKLSLNLQNLPSEKLDHIVQIIKKRNSAVSQQDDEIEVDIDSVDAETLWELDRFVSNYKKSLSKNKRKAEIAFQARANMDHNTREMYASLAKVETAKEAKADGENGEHAPAPGHMEKQGDNAGASSSSSSSSDSGSSSSDSDSESSSAYGSDGGQSPNN